MLRALYAFRLLVLAASVVIVVAGVVAGDLGTVLLGLTVALLAAIGLVRYRLVRRMLDEEGKGR